VPTGEVASRWLGYPWGSPWKEKTARAGDRPPGHDRCSFGSIRCTQANNPIAPKGGARRGSTGVRKLRSRGFCQAARGDALGASARASVICTRSPRPLESSTAGACILAPSVDEPSARALLCRTV
jgi:hypothetical protein